MNETLSYKIFKFFNYAILVGLGLCCVVPLFHILAVSFSDKVSTEQHLVGLWPVNFTLAAYSATIRNTAFIKSAWIAFERTSLGTVIEMLVITFAAYPLSKQKSEFKQRDVYMWFFVITMLFSGGIVPSFIVMKYVHLRNSIWSLILPSSMNVFLLIILINFFRTTIPRSVEEAAHIDGAGDLRVLFSIYFPLSLPVLATLSLFAIVQHWNSWFDGILYMEPENYPLATFLRNMIIHSTGGQTSFVYAAHGIAKFSERSIVASQIFLSTIPIFIAYPFLQRFFVTGIVLGSVKE